MKSTDGPMIEYELVYCFFKKKVYSLKEDGFFSCDGKRRGVLVRENSSGWHHLPEHYLKWTHSEAAK